MRVNFFMMAAIATAALASSAAPAQELTGTLKSVEGRKGKTGTSTSGTTNIKQITEIGAQRRLGLNILGAKDHAEGFLMVETDRAAAFVMDDILLYSLVAGARNPQDYVISAD